MSENNVYLFGEIEDDSRCAQIKIVHESEKIKEKSGEKTVETILIER